MERGFFSWVYEAATGELRLLGGRVAEAGEAVTGLSLVNPAMGHILRDIIDTLA